VEVINGNAVERGPLCQQIVVPFFGTVDQVRDDCEIEAWMVLQASNYMAKKLIRPFGE
jgi:hypothetical protein